MSLLPTSRLPYPSHGVCARIDPLAMMPKHGLVSSVNLMPGLASRNASNALFPYAVRQLPSCRHLRGSVGFLS